MDDVLEYKLGEKVIIFNTGSPELNGKTVSVVGIYTRQPLVDYYIVDLGFVAENGYTHIVMPSVCLYN